MRTVTVAEAQAELSDLLDEVARGESITIVRDGTPVARLGPAFDRGRIEEAFADMDRLREEVEAKGPPVTTEEILDTIREAREL
jgi:prevent-host-death family protein